VKHLPHRAGRPEAAAPIHHAPNAALLIDFDNVTLGVRSDLAKELRTLLNSDIIRGKVAVQRAYADWRRYPQYIVSLSESSIDLIFAPAFGTNKKNATDIRLAVDGIELVFTRPEIGTFILLSGDSDFSSLVLKLKEYGKYVIGVGIRESASDILIQNCDEYYSYSDLAGLSKEAEVPGPPRDPWELVGVAVEQMVRNSDVMRADRLKQVMQQIDPEFDEGGIGFNRFSKFVTEAATRGLIRIIKQDNGQLEVAPVKAVATTTPAPASSGRRSVATPATPARDAEDGAPSRRRRGGRGRNRARSDEAPGGVVDAAVTAVRTETPSRSPARSTAPVMTGLTLAEAFHLLSRALGELPAPVAHEALRARMAALHGKEDPLLEPGRFLKLLRQANDAEVADVRLVAEDEYEVSPHKSDLAMQMRAPVDATSTGETPAAPATPRPPAALRFRGGSRSTARRPDVPMVGVVDSPATAPVLVPVAPSPVAAVSVGDHPTAKPPRRAKEAAKPASAIPRPKPADTPKAAAKSTARSAKSAKPAKSAKGTKTSARTPSKPPAA
jgi:uncharacterized protein (TIGR00288 family)